MAKDKKPEMVPTEVNTIPYDENTKFDLVGTGPYPAAPAAPAQPLMNFDRYFATTGKPAHHKAGMAAYLSAKGGNVRKTRDAWASFFTKY